MARRLRVRHAHGLHRGRLLRAGAVPVLMLALAGCGEPEVAWPDDPDPEPASTWDAGETDAAAQALAAVDGYHTAAVELQAEPVPADQAREALDDHLTDPLLTVALVELDLLHSRGLTRQGQPRWASTVSAVDLDGLVPAVTVRDCLDATDWPVIDRATGGPATSDGLPEWFSPESHVIEWTVRQFDGRWLLAQAHLDREAQC